MLYAKSEPQPVPADDHINENTELHIRGQLRGVMVYAVFDGEEQVSDEFGPLGDKKCLFFARGYLQSKQKYDKDKN